MYLATWNQISVDFFYSRICQIIFSNGFDCFSRACFVFFDAMYHINFYVIVFDKQY